MVTFYMLQAGHINTVIYSRLATVKTFFPQQTMGK